MKNMKACLSGCLISFKIPDTYITASHQPRSANLLLNI
jgi:hypothetical protein